MGHLSLRRVYRKMQRWHAVTAVVLAPRRILAKCTTQSRTSRICDGDLKDRDALSEAHVVGSAFGNNWKILKLEVQLRSEIQLGVVLCIIELSAIQLSSFQSGSIEWSSWTSHMHQFR